VIELLLVASLAWLPFDKTLVVDLGFITVTPYYIAIVFLFGVAVVRVVRRRVRFRVGGTDVAIVIVCVMYFCSTMLADRPRVAGLLAFEGIFIPTLTYFVSKALLATEGVMFRAIKGYGLSVLVIAVVAVLAFISNPERSEPFGRDGVALSSLAVLPLMIGLYGLPNKSRALRGLLVAAGLIAIAVSIARAYWIFVLVSPVLFYLLLRGRAFMVGAAMLAVSFALTLAVTLDKSLVEPVSISSREDQGIERVLNPNHWKAAIYNRVALMYEASVESFIESPFFGKGLFVPAYQATTTHNLHLEWLESGGVFGYLAFLAVYLAHFRQLSRYGKGDALACAIGLASLGILVNGVTNGIMHSVMPTCAMLFVGLTAGRLESLRRREVGGRPIRADRVALRNLARQYS